MSLREGAIETVVPLKCTGNRIPRVKTEIAASRKEAKDQADFKIFTNGSGHGGKIGAAAIMYRKGLCRETDYRKFYLSGIDMKELMESGYQHAS